MTTERFPPVVTPALIAEARREGRRALPGAVGRGISNAVRLAVQARSVQPFIREIGPEISEEFANAILGERTVTSAFAAGQLKADFARRGIQLSERQAGDIFHKALIAGAVGGAGVIIATRGTAAIPVVEAFGTALALPLVRERKRRRTLMSIATKEGCVTRGRNGQITGLTPALRPLAARVTKAVKDKKPASLIQSLRRAFAARARTIGVRAARRGRRRRNG